MLKSTLQQTDPEIYNIIQEEAERQEYGIELIASENYTSKAVMEAMGSVLTNKYSEGYVGKRYYGGNEVIDKMEALAIDRCKKLFGCDHVNIQPLSGSPANAAVYFAVLKPGDKVLGLKLDHGGHLSHGHPVNFSGMLYNFVQYEVDKETGRIDMDNVREIALREKPKMILAGFSAYSRNLDWKRFKEIADEVGALTMADISHVAGLIAGKAIDSPVPYFDIVTTTTHKTLRGPRSAIIMCKDRTIQSRKFLWPRKSTRACSRVCRVVRMTTSTPVRPLHSSKLCSRNSRPTPRTSSRTLRLCPMKCRSSVTGLLVAVPTTTSSLSI